MDPTLILGEFAKQGLLIFGMAIIIGALYMDNRAIKKEYSEFRNSSQTKYEGLMEKVIVLTTNCANQLESFNKTITVMTSTLATWREEFLKGGK